MVALLGTSGAGKSTLLRAISGLGYPTAGSIRLQGSDITHVTAERRAHRPGARRPRGVRRPDYPHPEGTWPNTHDWIRDAFGDVPVDEARLILGENAIACPRT
jgi:energy-coupling factor transporter ATP-binding protein EcfA2